MLCGAYKAKLYGLDKYKGGIAELEEWVDKSHTINITEHEKDNSYEEYKTVDFAELKQKLNEMKGER